MLDSFYPPRLINRCATNNLESRKKDRYAAYSELTPEQRAAVDAGQIKVGMTMDAVFIAWGKPHQIVQGESSAGAQTVWLYMDTALQSQTYLGYRPRAYYGGGYGHYYPTPELRHDYVPVGYVKAAVIFEKGLVKQWRTLPAPPN